MVKSRRSEIDVEEKLSKIGKHLVVGRRNKEDIIASLKVGWVSRVNVICFNQKKKTRCHIRDDVVLLLLIFYIIHSIVFLVLFVWTMKVVCSSLYGYLLIFRFQLGF